LSILCAGRTESVILNSCVHPSIHPSTLYITAQASYPFAVDMSWKEFLPLFVGATYKMWIISIYFFSWCCSRLLSLFFQVRKSGVVYSRSFLSRLLSRQGERKLSQDCSIFSMPLLLRDPCPNHPQPLLLGTVGIRIPDHSCCFQLP